MSDYLPDVYLGFRERFPTIAPAVDQLGQATEAAGPLDLRTQRLVKLGIAVGALAEGAVRSNVRKGIRRRRHQRRHSTCRHSGDHDRRVPGNGRSSRLGRRGVGSHFRRVTRPYRPTQS